VPSAVISSTPDGANFDYTIKLTDESTSNAPIGTFWYAWTAQPNFGFLNSTPTNIVAPSGWIGMVTNGPPGDGYSIEYLASSPASYIQPGGSLNFGFTSADSPAVVNGNSVAHPGTPVGTSFVYPQGAPTNNPAEFAVAPASPTPTPTPAPLVTVSSVSDVQNGKTHLVTQVDVFFSGPVNSAQADSVNTYRLVMPGKKNSFTAKNATVVKLKSAVYNAANDEVVLTPKKPFALTKPVQLTVNGLAPAGLQDTEGRFINGGSNSIAVIRKAGVTLAAVALPANVADTALQKIDVMALDSAAMSADAAPSKPKSGS
jgi:hypothetical protein